MAQLGIVNLRKTFGDVEVLKGINLEIADREFVCFLGPSGCGKSTLLRAIAGLEEVTSGDIVIDGRSVVDLSPADRDLAMVFQSYALYPHMNVRKNMSFGLSLRKFPKAEIEKRIAEAARILQLEPLLERKPKQLSGGQRQRVAIGRAIVRNPRIFLFDEPLSNLDAALRVNTRVELARLHKELQATMVYVTHDQVEAMTLADRVVVMSGGRIEQFGKPLELYHLPANRFVAGFIGSPKMNFLPVTAAHSVDGHLTVTSCGVEIATQVQGQASDGLTLGIRPEHVQLVEPGSASLNGQVLMVERLGAESLAYVRLNGGEVVTVSVDGSHLIRDGETVGLQPDPVHCHLFDAQGQALPRTLPPELAHLLQA